MIVMLIRALYLKDATWKIQLVYLKEQSLATILLINELQTKVSFLIIRGRMVQIVGMNFLISKLIWSFNNIY